RVRDVEQLEVRDDVLVVDRDVLEVLEEVEHDVGPEAFDRRPDDAQVGADAETLDLVAERPERLPDEVLGPPFHGVEVGVAGLVGRNGPAVHARQDLELAGPALAVHSATRWRPLCRKFIVWTVRRTAKSSFACGSGTARRSSSSRQRWTMSSNTWSTV